MRKKTLTVKAAHEGRPCPKLRTRSGPYDKTTGRDRSMIYHDDPVDVPNCRFYRRRIAKGDLVLVDAMPKPVLPKPKETPLKKRETKVAED